MSPMVTLGGGVLMVSIAGRDAANSGEEYSGAIGKTVSAGGSGFETGLATVGGREAG